MTTPFAAPVPLQKIAAALATVQAKLPKVRKSETANTGSYEYRYADLAGVSEDLLPLLGENGLAWITMPTLREGRFVLAYMLVHTSGERLEGEYPLTGSTPQALGGAITYARRYCLCAVTGVVPDDGDDDAKAAQQEALEDRKRGQQRQAAPRRAERPAPAARPDRPVEPRMINTEQSKKLHALFRDADLGDRDAALAYCAEAVGREVSSTKELTLAEASAVIDRLVRFVEQSTPPVDAAEPEGAPA
ncbi:ERF family protein [Catenuloplanes sp. NPDC051500]|uniref:ERF family protein n=1 Tax=Catenuloplanes sp. NPDC051500 TaxID=3363959 RepID=UPI0037A2B4DC